jgi:sulfite exporter TauE/SafE
VRGWPRVGLGRAGSGDIAGWLLTGFGFAYLVWGIRAALRNRPHTHLHAHADGTVHAHTHTHDDEHMHVHAEAANQSATPWALFIIFVFGPCEPLIPLLMYPAAAQSLWSVALVSLVFGAATIVTMIAAVLIGCSGVRLLAWRGLERYTHAFAGAALMACGLAVTLGL